MTNKHSLANTITYYCKENQKSCKHSVPCIHFINTVLVLNFTWWRYEVQNTVNWVQKANSVQDSLFSSQLL